MTAVQSLNKKHRRVRCSTFEKSEFCQTWRDAWLVAQQRPVEQIGRDYGSDAQVTRNIKDRTDFARVRSSEYLKLLVWHGQIPGEMPKNETDKISLVIEVPPSWRRCLFAERASHELTNLRIYEHGCRGVLADCIRRREFSQSQLYFPWPFGIKKKHHKSSLYQAWVCCRTCRN